MGKELYKDKNNFTIKNYLIIFDLSDIFSDICDASIQNKAVAQLKLQDVLASINGII